MLSSLLAHSRKHIQMGRASLGSFEANCYLIQYSKDKLLVVDPGENPGVIIDYLKNIKSQISECNVYLTHGHFDHTAGLPDVCNVFPNAKVFASKKDMQLFTSAKYNLSDASSHPFTLEKYLDKFVFVKDGEVLPLRGLNKNSNEASKNSESDEETFTVIETPGHSPGSTLLKVENKTQKMLFTGDTLFQGSIGNTELLLGDYDQIMKSIMEKVYPLPDEFIVFPGHGFPTTVGAEKKENPFILDELKKRNQ